MSKFLHSHSMYREVAPLAHESRDNTVERGAFVAETFLSGAQSAEVLCSLGYNVSPELHRNATEGSSIGRYVKVNFTCHLVRDL